MYDLTEFNSSFWTGPALLIDVPRHTNITGISRVLMFSMN